MNTLPKIVGYIDMPNAPVKDKCICHDCGNQLNDSFGDPRVRITTIHHDGSKETRMICSDCEFEQFNDNLQPSNIFDGVPDWIRVL
jgi:hypothetical protein